MTDSFVRTLHLRRLRLRGVLLFQSGFKTADKQSLSKEETMLTRQLNRSARL